MSSEVESLTCTEQQHETNYDQLEPLYKPGEVLQFLRTSVPLSLRELSKLTGITPANLSRMERGITAARASSLKRIVTALGKALSVNETDLASSIHEGQIPETLQSEPDSHLTINIVAFTSRAQSKRTLREVAAKAGMSHNSLSTIETGVHKPRPSTVRKMAPALGLNPRELAHLRRKS